VLTFKNSKLADVVKEIPIEQIVLETDSPYLAPVPYRGKRNESSYVKLVAEALAAVKGIDFEEAAFLTSSNAMHVFNKLANDN
jgi:TatD DNase family protein